MIFVRLVAASCQQGRYKTECLFFVDIPKFAKRFFDLAEKKTFDFASCLLSAISILGALLVSFFLI